MNRRRAVGIAALMTLTAGCTREVQSQDSTTTSLPVATTTTVASTTAPSTTVPGGGQTTAPPSTAPSTTAAATTTTPTTVPVVSSVVVGVAVAGSAGGIGADQTDSFSEVVRNEDGSCTGWTGRDVPQPWTDGLATGAPFFIIARDSSNILGEGTIGQSSFENVGGATEQWNCYFPFEATVDGNPDEFMIKVANLDPWLVRRDPTDPDRFVSSVNTVASADSIPECAQPSANPITPWTPAVGQYWSRGLQALCSAGFTVDGIERPCRGPREGSDHVVKVVSAGDPNIVYEDASGIQVADLATLPPGAPVRVLVATGRPCG